MHPGRVYRVEHVVMIDGAKHYAVTDMIFNGKQPIAVLIWGRKPGKDYPLVSVRLDLVHLSEHRDGQITHRYEHPIEADILSLARHYVAAKRRVHHGWSGAYAAIVQMLGLWRERHRQRQELAMLSDRDLRDTGVTRDLVAHEAGKWPWQAWHPQLRAFEEAARRRTLGQR